MKKLALATAALLIAAPAAFAQGGGNPTGRSGSNAGGNASSYPGTAQTSDPSKPSTMSADQDHMKKMGTMKKKSSSSMMKKKNSM